MTDDTPNIRRTPTLITALKFARKLGEFTSPDLAELTGKTLRQTRTHVHEMCGKGLVERLRRVPRNGRAGTLVYAISDAGKEILDNPTRHQKHAERQADIQVAANRCGNNPFDWRNFKQPCEPAPSRLW